MATLHRWTEEDVLRAIARGEIEVRRSARRKKTISVSKEVDTYVLSTPVRYSVEHNIRSLTDLFNRLAARDHSSASDLVAVADEMNARYFDGRLRPQSIRWVTNQNISRWASTTTSSGDIRVSHRLQAVPRWVLETVIVHELAHLQVGPHNKAFHELADRHPRQAEAKLYLEGFSAGEQFSRGGGR
ncbi:MULTISPECIES: M48 family metallopeptidase [unclassified Brevibacterium]|uniref:M48 metallopeptidase family protein n=1 Tax=unclassified Brevibacterium TaxID=2614124 RepID=UPI000C77EF77|nr:MULTISPECIES: M48 family metallopeptidase [unclassified Brevibacterium]